MRLASGGALGIGIGGLQLFLLRDVVQYAFTLHPEGRYGAARTAAMNFAIPLWPYLLGQLMEPWDPVLYPLRVNWEALPLAVGGVQLLLVLLGLAAAARRDAPNGGDPGFGAVAPYAVVLAVFFGIVAGESAGLSGLWGWGPFSRVNFPRYGAPVTSLMVALLAGWGVSRLSVVRLREVVLANGALAVLALVAIWLVAPAFLAPSEQLYPAYRDMSIPLGIGPFAIGVVGANLTLMGLVAGRVTIPRAQVALFVCLFAELAAFVRYGLPLERELGRLGVTALLVGTAVLVLVRRDRVAVLVAVAAVSLQVGIIATAPSQLQAMFDPFETEPAYLQFLRGQVGEGASGGRILGTLTHTQANVASSYGVAELAGLQPVLPDATSIYVREVLGDKQVPYPTPVSWGSMTTEDGPLSRSWYFDRRAFFNVLNARFLVEPPGGWLARNAAGELRLVYQDERSTVYEDPLALPRAYTVDRVTPAVGIVDAVRRPRAPGVDPRTLVVAETPPDALPQSLRRDGPATIEPATIARYEPAAIDLVVETAEPALLILADAYYPRWTATLDGAPVPVLRVNTTVRGVVVPSGRHEISFRYALVRTEWGLALSGASVVAALGLLAAGVVTRRRRPIYNQAVARA